MRGSVPWLPISSAFHPAPDTEEEAPSERMVDGRGLLGADDRVALHEQAHAGSDADSVVAAAAAVSATKRSSVCGYSRPSAPPPGNGVRRPPECASGREEERLEAGRLGQLCK